MNVLEITTSIGCANRCECCPQGVLAEAYQIGKRKFCLDDWEECLRRIPHEIEIGFCGFTEPFMNPLCSIMIQMTHRKKFVQRLLTTLIGFDEHDIPVMKDAKIHYIRFHLPDKTQFKFDAKRWIKLHELFYSMRIPAEYDYMAMGAIDDELHDYLDGIGVEKISYPRLISRAGSVWNAGTIGGKIFCSQDRWHYNVLLPNGDVYLCCMDWGLKHKLGNLLEQPYSDIYDAAEELRYADHSTMICSKCELGVKGHWTTPFGIPSMR